MSYLKPTLAPVAAQTNDASCCTPLLTVNLGRVVIGGGCLLPGRQGTIIPGGFCTTPVGDLVVCTSG